MNSIVTQFTGGECWSNILLRVTTKKTLKFHFTGPLWRHTTGHWWFAWQRASYVESISISWYHDVNVIITSVTISGTAQTTNAMQDGLWLWVNHTSWEHQWGINVQGHDVTWPSIINILDEIPSRRWMTHEQTSLSFNVFVNQGSC